MNSLTARALAGLAAIVAIVAIVAMAIGLFRGSFTETVPVTVVSDRAGLVMNPDAKVKMRGVEVGRVASIAPKPDGGAVLKLDMNPAQLQPDSLQCRGGHHLDDGVRRQVRRARPAEGPFFAEAARGAGDRGPTRHHRDQHRLPAARHRAGQDRPGETQRDPRRGRDGVQRPRREDRPYPRRTSTRFWPRSIRACRTWPTTSKRPCRRSPHTAMRRPISSPPSTIPSRLSNSIVEEQQNLDEFLISSIGLADIGNEVIGGNRQALSDTLRVLVPTTTLRGQYHETLGCTIGGLVPFVNGINPVFAHPCSTRASRWGPSATAGPRTCPRSRRRLEAGPICRELGLPNVPAEFRPPFLVADTGSNPFKYGNQGILLNSDGLKQWLFGPIPGTAPEQRDDRNAGVTRMRGTFIKFGIFGVVMVLLTAFLFATFAEVQNGFGQRLLRGLQGRIAAGNRGHRARRRHPGGHRAGRRPWMPIAMYW